MHKINRTTVLRYFLGFVVIWFGVNEIMHPASWAGFAPSFLQNLEMINSLVILHGIVLLLLGLALIFSFHQRIAAFVLFLMLAEIVVTLLYTSGLSEVAVRDIGLLGMAFALSLKN